MRRPQALQAADFQARFRKRAPKYFDELLQAQLLRELCQLKGWRPPVVRRPPARAAGPVPRGPCNANCRHF